MIDVKQHTAYVLEAVQRDCIDTNRTLVDHYGDIIVERSKALKRISEILVCDAYFIKKKFVDKVCDQACMEMIGRLRDDYIGLRHQNGITEWEYDQSNIFHLWIARKCD